MILHFNSLPVKSKPRTFPDGSREWTPISGVVLALNQGTSEEELRCIAVASGSKCLPQSTLPLCKGQILHDCHAEILALRGLNYFLISEILHILRGLKGSACWQSKYLRLRKERTEHEIPFELSPNVSIHMFSTEAPCGDASMEILIGDKPEDERQPWATPRESDALRGRGYFQDLGIVRRKPSRPDAPPTMSKSCTDKLTLRQVISLLSFPACLFIAPTANAYLSSLILPGTRYSSIACTRAFTSSGRMGDYKDTTADNMYKYRPFHVETVNIHSHDLPYARPLSGKAKTGNVSGLWIAGQTLGSTAVNESLINGVKQGYKQLSADARRCSVVSRINMVLTAQDIFAAMQKSGLLAHRFSDNDICGVTTFEKYKTVHISATTPFRPIVKNDVGIALGGWPANIGDHDWDVVDRLDPGIS